MRRNTCSRRCAALYFSRTEQATFADAGAYAERYRVAADALNDEERRSRSTGSLDDFGVARLSSFLKSYSEMRRGEQFVMDEVRARARTRVRWLVSAGLLALALIAAPLPWRRLWPQRETGAGTLRDSGTAQRDVMKSRPTRSAFGPREKVSRRTNPASKREASHEASGTPRIPAQHGIGHHRGGLERTGPGVRPRRRHRRRQRPTRKRRRT